MFRDLLQGESAQTLCILLETINAHIQQCAELGSAHAYAVLKAGCITVRSDKVPT